MLLYLRFPHIGWATAILIGLAGVVAGGGLFLVQAYQTHQALCKSRNELMRRLLGE